MWKQTQFGPNGEDLEMGPPEPKFEPTPPSKWEFPWGGLGVLLLLWVCVSPIFWTQIFEVYEAQYFRTQTTQNGYWAASYLMSGAVVISALGCFGYSCRDRSSPKETKPDEGGMGGLYQ